jgi:hypothetical protein
MMIELVREYVIREDMCAHFELTFGPGGACSELLGPSPGFRGLTLMRDVADPRRYLVVEVWESQERRAEALAARQTGFSELEASFDRLASSRKELGNFRLLPEASVRPHPRPKRT